MNDNSMTYNTAVSYRDTLDNIWRSLDSDEAHESTMFEDDMRAELDELPLEIVYEMGEPFAVVLGTGGPHIEITGGGREGGYTLHVYWAGDHVTLRGESITRTGEYFREQVEQGYEGV